MNKPPDWDENALALLPPLMQEGITAYVMKGRPAGGFLTAIICNNLALACMKADNVNKAIIPDYVKFFHNSAPSRCWGSVESMNEWIADGGWEGLYPDE